MQKPPCCWRSAEAQSRQPLFIKALLEPVYLLSYFFHLANFSELSARISIRTCFKPSCLAVSITHLTAASTTASSAKSYSGNNFSGFERRDTSMYTTVMYPTVSFAESALTFIPYRKSDSHFLCGHCCAGPFDWV